jgi:surface antigen
MNRSFIPLVAAILLGTIAAHANPKEPLAARETWSLSERDRLAAAKAEFEALDRDEVINNFAWHGQDGAEGLLIISGQFPSLYGMGGCRRLVHIVRHPGDGGVNATFDGVVCRDWEGKWSVREK